MKNKIKGDDAKRMCLIPYHWDEEGRVLEWRARDDGPLKPGMLGKFPFSWHYERGGMVDLWAYTRPANPIERISWEEMTAAQRDHFNARNQTLGSEVAAMRFQLGPCSKRPKEWREILQLVDNLDSMTAELENRPDRWGKPAQRSVRQESGDMTLPEKTKPQLAKACASLSKCRKAVVNVLGEWLLEIVGGRDAQTLSDFAGLLKETKGISFSFGSSDAERVWHDVKSFSGTVFRCYRVLMQWSFDKGLPTKRCLREYVTQEWLAMGGSEITVETEFSDTLKKLSLHGLPNASSRPLNARKRGKTRKL